MEEWYIRNLQVLFSKDRQRMKGRITGNPVNKHTLENSANDQEFGEQEDQLDDSGLPSLSGRPISLPRIYWWS